MISAFRIGPNLQAFGELLGLLSRYRALMLEMTRREISTQYAGQVIGTLWAIGHPLFMMALYVFVFGVVFKQRIGGTYELPLDYTAYILTSLVPWLAFQQAMSRSCSALTGHANLVKQVVFPIEILPATIVLSGFLPLGVGVVVLVIYVLFVHSGLHATYLLLPVLVLLQAAAMLGVAMAFSAIGAFLRDLKDLVQMFTTAGVYLMPAFYLPQWVPDMFKPVLYLNPFSYMIWCYQDALYFGRFEHPWAWVAFCAGSLLSFAVGYRLFRRLKPHLGNVL